VTPLYVVASQNKTWGNLHIKNEDLAFFDPVKAKFPQRLWKSREQATMPTVEEAETAFADLVKEYDNQWIAFVEREGVRVIVGSGRNAVEAVAEADAKGFPDAILFKVPSLRTSFVPLVSAPAAH
jgi:hypothetical protein